MLIGFVLVCMVVFDALATFARKAPFIFWLSLFVVAAGAVTYAMQGWQVKAPAPLAGQNVFIVGPRGPFDTTIISNPPRAFRVTPAPARKPELTMEQRIERLDWFQFEKLIAMLYRARGCGVDRRGGANPDGGIDLVVVTEGIRVGVQCKFWKAKEVGVREVRELLGALQDQGLPKGRIVSFKGFTDQARDLATRNGIELLGKSAVVQMLNEVRYTAHIREINCIMDSDDKRCPKCERQMAKRTSSKDGNKFWGCSGFPRCRYTMAL